MVRVVSIPYFYHLDELQQLIPMVCVRACVRVRACMYEGFGTWVEANQSSQEAARSGGCMLHSQLMSHSDRAVA